MIIGYEANGRIILKRMGDHASLITATDTPHTLVIPDDAALDINLYYVRQTSSGPMLTERPIIEIPSQVSQGEPVNLGRLCGEVTLNGVSYDVTIDADTVLTFETSGVHKVFVNCYPYLVKGYTITCS